MKLSKGDSKIKGFRSGKFIRYYFGSKEIRAHIDAVHAAPPCSDKFTGEIVEGVVKKINCCGIIAIVSRCEANLNRPRSKKNKDAIDEYRYIIQKIQEHINNLDKNRKALKPYLHLAIHGMSNKWNIDMEIGTLEGKTCSINVKNWFINEIKNRNEIIKNLQMDTRFHGNISKSVHRCGYSINSTDYLGYGKNFNTFQVEISRTLREYYRDKIIDMFSDIIINFNRTF